MNVNEIFISLDGEYNAFLGAGQPTIFLRLQGCNLHCKWCDATEAQGDNGKSMTVENVATTVRDLSKYSGIRHLTITGGEPLIQQPALVKLLDLLDNCIDTFTIETNGTIAPQAICSLGCNHERLRYIVDCKLPSAEVGVTKVNGSFVWASAFKVVVANDLDWKYLVSMLKEKAFDICKPLIVSPVLNRNSSHEKNLSWARTLANFVLATAEMHPRLIFGLQIHKILGIR